MLDRAEAPKYNAVAARDMYLEVDRPDRAAGLDRDGGVESEGGGSSTYKDSEWAGCRRSRKSMGGGKLTAGGMSVNTWSSAKIRRDQQWRGRTLHVDARDWGWELRSGFGSTAPRPRLSQPALA